MTKNTGNPKTNIVPQSESFSWVNIPRYINLYLADKQISYVERLLYLHLRAEADMYGYTTTTVDDIRQTFPYLKIATLNKYLSNLKCLGLIAYVNRKGKRGKFRIYHSDFFVPDNKTPSPSELLNILDSKDVDMLFAYKSQVDEKVMFSNRMSLPTNNVLTTAEKVPEFPKKFAYPNNNKNINKNTNTVLNNSYKCSNLVSTYRPQNYEEDKALDIAKFLGEECFDFYLSIISKNKFYLLEKAFNELKEDLDRGVQINEKNKYLTQIYLRLERDAIGEKWDVNSVK